MNQQREQVLKQTFKEVKRLRNEIPEINIVADGDLLVPDRYQVEMEILSFIIKDRKADYYPLFRLEIILPSDFPYAPPQCIVFPPIPFHPHFRIQQHRNNRHHKKWGEWVDYKHYSQEGLRSFILRIAHSLQYRPNYIIETHLSRMGNADAFNWYQQTKQEQPERFPSDHVKLPPPFTPYSHSSSPTRPSHKKFEINADEGTSQPSRKTFQIESTTSPHELSETPENRSAEVSLTQSESPETTRAEVSLTQQADRQVKFEDVNVTEPYSPKEKPEEAFPTIRSLASDLYEGREFTHRLYISKKAKEQIFTHIAWGETTDSNKIEQGGLLFGEVFRDPEKNLIYGIVREAIPGKNARGWDTYLEIDHKAWKEIIDQVDEILETEPEQELQIIGWYHTHPNELRVFMSDTDLATQKLIFAEDWHFAVVLNPHRRKWNAFHGKEANECKGFIMNESELSHVD